VALAQTATIAAASAGGAEGKVGLFAGIDKVRFKRVCKPGDRLRLEAEVTAVHGAVGRARVTATVDGQLACRGELLFAVVDAAAVAAGEARL
jgi:3-hydroxyacyl-[acyl-carrier-protein] dehydratase